MKKLFFVSLLSLFISACTYNQIDYNGKIYQLNPPTKSRTEAIEQVKATIRKQEQTAQKEKLSSIWLGKKVYDKEHNGKEYTITDIKIEDKEYCIPPVCENKYFFALIGTGKGAKDITELRTYSNSDDILSGEWESQMEREEMNKRKKETEEIYKNILSAPCDPKNWNSYEAAHNLLVKANQAKITPWTLVNGTEYERRNVTGVTFYDESKVDMMIEVILPVEERKEIEKKYYNRLINRLNFCYQKLK